MQEFDWCPQLDWFIASVADDNVMMVWSIKHDGLVADESDGNPCTPWMSSPKNTPPPLVFTWIPLFAPLHLYLREGDPIFCWRVLGHALWSAQILILFPHSCCFYCGDSARMTDPVYSGDSSYRELDASDESRPKRSRSAHGRQERLYNDDRSLSPTASRKRKRQRYAQDPRTPTH